MEKHRNNFTLLRLLAAIFVVVSHSYFLTSNETNEPLRRLSNQTLIFSDIGLYIFFFTSGYLVTNSVLQSNSLWQFTCKRALRIYPALIFVTLITVFIAGPILSKLSLTNYFNNKQTWQYLITISGIRIKSELPEVFSGKYFFSNSVNGALWSIALEIKLYFVLLLLKIVAVKKTEKVLSIITCLIVVTCFTFLATNITYLNGKYDSKIPLLIAIFFIGSFVKTARLKYKQLQFILLLLTLILAISCTFGFVSLLSLLLSVMIAIITYLLAYQNQFVINLQNDISYGIYIYAFLVQQALFQYSNYKMGAVENLVLTLIITIPIAFLSWKFIEEPALQLKHRFIKSSALS